VYKTQGKAIHVLGGKKELVLFQASYPAKICDTSITKDISQCS